MLLLLIHALQGNTACGTHQGSTGACSCRAGNSGNYSLRHTVEQHRCMFLLSHELQGNTACSTQQCSSNLQGRPCLALLSQIRRTTIKKLI
jgi:hypothetical protein